MDGCGLADGCGVVVRIGCGLVRNGKVGVVVSNLEIGRGGCFFSVK